MKHLLTIAAIIGTLALGACSDAQLAAFNLRVGNFVSAVHTVDTALKDVNSTLYSNCTSYVAVAQSINDLAGSCSKAAPYTSAANAVIDNYCQSSQIQTNGGIGTSIAVTAQSISAAKSTLAANKKACAGG